MVPPAVATAIPRSTALYFTYMGPVYRRKATISASVTSDRFASGDCRRAASFLALRPSTIMPSSTTGSARSTSNVQEDLSRPSRPTTKNHSRSGVVLISCPAFHAVNCFEASAFRQCSLYIARMFCVQRAHDAVDARGEEVVRREFAADALEVGVLRELGVQRRHLAGAAGDTMSRHGRRSADIAAVLYRRLRLLLLLR